jgi:hypothetical protein
MAKIDNHKISFPLKMLQKDGRVSLLGFGIEVGMLPFVKNRLTGLNFESEEVTLNLECSFKTKSENGEIKVNESSDKDLNYKILSIELPSLTLENFNMVSPGNEDLRKLVIEIINDEINAGKFEEVLSTERKPWSEEEAIVALEIYVKSLNMAYADQMALIDQYIKEGRLNRSFYSVRMMVHGLCYFDSDHPNDGFSNLGQVFRQVWDNYKAGLIKFD